MGILDNQGRPSFSIWGGCIYRYGRKLSNLLVYWSLNEPQHNTLQRLCHHINATIIENKHRPKIVSPYKYNYHWKMFPNYKPDNTTEANLKMCITYKTSQVPHKLSSQWSRVITQTLPINQVIIDKLLDKNVSKLTSQWFLFNTIQNIMLQKWKPFQVFKLPHTYYKRRPVALSEKLWHNNQTLLEN